MTTTPMPLASSRRGTGRMSVLGFAAVLTASGMLLWHFHDRVWIPADDGHYAHVAERLLAGEVLNRDVQELHPGYVHVFHAFALAWFGKDLVSLRYPLLLLSLIQSCVIYLVFLPRGLPLALAAAAVATSFGLLQIANPTPSLYGLFGVYLLLASMNRFGSRSRGRVECFGFIIGLIFLFRQLTGVFVGMGVLAFLLVEGERPAQRGDVWTARLVLGGMLIGLILYLTRATSWIGFALFGWEPIALLVAALVLTSRTRRETVKIMCRLALGAVAAAIPLLAYHGWHGSLGFWIDDCFVRALHVAELGHLDLWSYGTILGGSLESLVGAGGIVSRSNAIYWLVLLLLSSLNAGFLLRRLSAGATLDAWLVFPFLAVFHALVSVFMEIPYYLYLSVGVSLLGLLSMWSDSLWKGRFAAGFSLFLAAVAVMFHAGQPYTRSYPDMIRGARETLVPSGFARGRLWIAGDWRELYEPTLEAIRRESRPDEALFVLPNNPELYFLSDRRNPVRVFNPTLSLLDEREVRAFAAELGESRPRLIIHNTHDKYNTALTMLLVSLITTGYEHRGTIGWFNFYRRVQ